jgi:hypothetical protein
MDKIEKQNAVGEKQQTVSFSLKSSNPEILSKDLMSNDGNLLEVKDLRTYFKRKTGLSKPSMASRLI